MTRTNPQGSTLDTGAAYRGPSWRAAQERVTPHELAEAVAAVERRHAEPPRHDGRIALGEAVEQLGLDVTPEELLAEVEARRRAEALARFAQAQRRQRVRWGAAVLAAGALWAGGVVGATLLPQQLRPSSYAAPATAPVATITPDAIPVVRASGDGLVVTTLAQLPEGTTTTVDTAALRRLLNVPTELTEYLRGGSQWTLFRRGGTVYLRGHIPAPKAGYVTLAGPLTLHNRPETDGIGKPLTSPVALPIGSFRVVGAVYSTAHKADQRLVIDYIRASVDKWAGAE